MTDFFQLSVYTFLPSFTVPAMRYQIRRQSRLGALVGFLQDYKCILVNIPCFNMSNYLNRFTALKLLSDSVRSRRFPLALDLQVGILLTQFSVIILFADFRAQG